MILDEWIMRVLMLKNFKCSNCVILKTNTEKDVPRRKKTLLKNSSVLQKTDRLYIQGLSRTNLWNATGCKIPDEFFTFSNAVQGFVNPMRPAQACPLLENAKDVCYFLLPLFENGDPFSAILYFLWKVFFHSHSCYCKFHFHKKILFLPKRIHQQYGSKQTMSPFWQKIH